MLTRTRWSCPPYELRKSGHPQAATVLKIVPGAEHNEGFWSGELREALLWMFAPSRH